MQVLVKCWTPEFIDDPTHVVIDVTKTLAQYIWERMELAKRLKALDQHFLGLRYDDYSPEFMDFGPNDLEAICGMMDGSDGGEYGEEDFDSAMEAGCLILPRKFEPAVPTSMRPCSLQISDTDFQWIAYHKHGGAESRAETYSCTEKDLNDWAAELKFKFETGQ
ncbi:MAG: hypothetical protein ACXAC5_02155 [Promethearchaeota archaeon]|jgi:hypothetical protein